MTYTAFATTNTTDEGVPVGGIMVKGNDIISTSTIKANVEAAGFRDGSYINGTTLTTSQRQLLLSDAITNAEEQVKKSTIPGTSIAPISTVDIQVDTNTGNVVVTVVEDFSLLQTNNTTTNSSEENSSSEITTSNSSTNNTTTLVGVLLEQLSQTGLYW